MILQARDKIIAPENEYVEIIIKQMKPGLNKKRKIAHVAPTPVKKHVSAMYQQNQWQHSLDTIETILDMAWKKRKKKKKKSVKFNTKH